MMDKMQEDLMTAGRWFACNCLMLNVSKTKFMVFATNQMIGMLDDVTLTFNDEMIEPVKEFKYLGVKLDQRLSYTEHVN